MSIANVTDSDLDKKSRKTCEKISENIYILANEPTLACFRIQEHVCKTGPNIAEKGVLSMFWESWLMNGHCLIRDIRFWQSNFKNEMRKLNNSLKGNVYDIDYALKAIKSMPASKVHLRNIQELLKNALFYKQQLDYEENVRIRVASSRGAQPSAKTSSQKKSAFQRFSGSFDTFFNSSFGGIASSASADLKTVISQFASPSQSTSASPSSRRSRTESVSTSSSQKSDDTQESQSNNK